MDFEEHDVGASWLSGDALFKASHALVHDGRVWIVDPVDAGDALERARALGEPVAVLQLLDRHNRDSAAVAQRLGVPHLKVPAVLPETHFSVLNLDWGRMWKEVALWWPARDGLVVAEVLGTAEVWAITDRAVGVHPFVRLTPPTTLRRFAPKTLLVGHGAPLTGADTADLTAQAIAHSRREMPRLLLKLPAMIRTGRQL